MGGRVGEWAGDAIKHWTALAAVNFENAAVDETCRVGESEKYR